MGALTDYLAELDPSTRAALERVRALAAEVAPDAVEGTGYGMAALRLGGKPLLGLLAGRDHLSIFPFSAAVVEAVADRLAGFSLSKGTIRFTADRPVPEDVVLDVVRLRAEEITGAQPADR